MTDTEGRHWGVNGVQDLPICCQIAALWEASAMRRTLGRINVERVTN